MCYANRHYTLNGYVAMLLHRVIIEIFNKTMSVDLTYFTKQYLFIIVGLISERIMNDWKMDERSLHDYVRIDNIKFVLVLFDQN